MGIPPRIFYEPCHGLGRLHLRRCGHFDLGNLASFEDEEINDAES
jgi:hypothetical protein